MHRFEWIGCAVIVNLIAGFDLYGVGLARTVMVEAESRCWFWVKAGLD